MPSSEPAHRREDLASFARAAADAGLPTAVRCQALRALGTALGEQHFVEMRDQYWSVLAALVADEHQPREVRDEAFNAIRPVIRLTAGQVARPFSGQPGLDLLKEAESYIWERLPNFRPGPFRSWCHRVLRNLVLDWLRRRKVDLLASAVPVSQVQAELGRTSTTPWSDITEQLTAQIAAIRQVFLTEEDGGAVLLLSERLRLAQVIANSYEPEDGRTIGNQTLCEIVEVVASWEPVDAVRVLAPRELPLGQVWETIRDRMQDRPQEAGPKEIAEILGGNRINWNQSVCRARSRLAQRLGAAPARQLFPHWPAGAFERAAGGTKP